MTPHGNRTDEAFAATCAAVQAAGEWVPVRDGDGSPSIRYANRRYHIRHDRQLLTARDGAVAESIIVSFLTDIDDDWV